MVTVIEARNLHKSFTSQTKDLKIIKALDGLSLDIYEGEVLGILGPNGAGKTTFLNILSTLLIQDKGEVRILGLPLISANFKHIRKVINLSSGYPNFPWSLTVEENLMFYGRLYNLSGKKLKEKVDQLIDTFQLRHCYRQRFDELSSGTKQRLSLAKVLLNDPKIIFLDEPTIGLDPDAAFHMREIIHNIIRKQDVTVLLTTHNMNEAEGLCDRVAFIKAGRVLKLATPSELKNTYAKKSLEDVFIELAHHSQKDQEIVEEKISSESLKEKQIIIKKESLGEEITGWLNRTWAFVYRNYLFAVRNVFTFAELIFWPMVTLISIGLLGDYLSLGKDASAFILTGAITGGILQVAQLDVAYSLLYEVWSKSMKHLFLAPLGISEHLFGSWVIGMIRGAAVFLLLGASAIVMFGFQFPSFFVTAIFLFGIFCCAIILGLLVSFLVLIFGQKAEITAWMFAYVAMLLSGIYYPVETLPAFFAWLARIFPVTYFLEYFRLSFGFEASMSHLLLRGFALVIVYIILGLYMLRFALDKARRKGTLIRLSE